MHLTIKTEGVIKLKVAVDSSAVHLKKHVVAISAAFQFLSFAT